MIDLEPEQEALLIEMIEAAHSVPRPQQAWHLERLDQGDFLSGPGGHREVLASDVDALERAGMLTGTAHNYVYGNDYVIAPAGHRHYAAIKQNRGQPTERMEAAPRRFIDSDAFRSAYPAAYARWSEAEALLWSANSEREFTTIGHKAREAMQEFATEALSHYGPSDAEGDPVLVKRRVGAIIAMFKPALGDKRSMFLSALGDLWEATHGIVQRQEHGGQKEGQPLTWDDAHRVVFHLCSVMYELAITFDSVAGSDVPPAAHIEGGPGSMRGWSRT